MENVKNAFNPLPVVVGITGHRDIPSEATAALEEQVEAQILHIKKLYPHCPVLVLSSLAEGADRLCARAALKTGSRLHVPLPMPREEYEKDFDEASLAEFSELLSRADSVFVVEAMEQAPNSGPSRGYFYRQAGLYIVERAHVLIALWDGEEAVGADSGGTFETVDLMRRNNGVICHIPTPRQSGPAMESC